MDGTQPGEGSDTGVHDNAMVDSGIN